MTFRQYPTARVVAWLDSIDWRVPSRRAWKKFTDWAYETHGDFSELTGSGGFSGAPKLQTAIAVLRHFRASGRACDIATVGGLIDLANREQLPLGFLPPVDVAVKVAKLAGRPAEAERLAAVGF